MNINDLIKLGTMIRRTSTQVTMQKTAQFLRHVANYAPTLGGALAGGAGGYLGHQAAFGDKGSTLGSAASTIGGGIGGALTGAAITPGQGIFSRPDVLEALHAFGGSGAMPALGGLLGAGGGYVAGHQLAPHLGLEDNRTATGLLGMGLGGVLGATGGAGLGSGLRNWSAGRARGTALEQGGEDIANRWRNLAQASGDPQVAAALAQDPQNLVGRMMASQSIESLQPRSLFQGLGSNLPQGISRGDALFSEVNPNLWRNWGPQQALQVASSLGIQAPSQAGLWMQQNLPAGSQNYLRGAALAGGGYLGLGALADLKNRFSGPQQQQQDGRRGVIVL